MKQLEKNKVLTFLQKKKKSRSEEEVLISRIVEKALRRSRAIDTEGLCIVSGEKVWQIRVDLLFLDYNGNLVDCACIAAITALLHFRRPDVTVSGEDVTIVGLLLYNHVFFLLTSII